MGLALKAVSTIVGGQMLSDASAFVQSLDSMFGGFRRAGAKTYELLSAPGTQFLVIAAAEPDALREASFFVDRLTTEQMPFAGLVVNRTHPTLSSLPADHALTAADKLDESRVPEREWLRQCYGFTRNEPRERNGKCTCCSGSPAPTRTWREVGVPSLPFEVSDLEALRAIGDELTRAG